MKNLIRIVAPLIILVSLFGVQQTTFAQESQDLSDGAIEYNQFLSEQWLEVTSALGKFTTQMTSGKGNDLELHRDALLQQIDESSSAINEKKVFDSNYQLRAAMLQLLESYRGMAQNEMVEISTLLKKDNIHDRERTRCQELTNQMNMTKTTFERGFVDVQRQFAENYGLLFFGGSLVKDGQ